MRLICPSCGAQYEVDDAVIPEGGRDVQCSACGHAWFEAKPVSRAEAAPAGTLTPEPEEEPAPEASSPVAEVEPEPTEEGAGAPSPVAPAAAVTAHPETETRRRTLDEAVLNVLREEAEREERARRAEGLSVAAAQPDLGLGRAAPAPTPAAPVPEPERVVHLDTDPAHDDADPRGSRRDLLPDIEEINSTLAASNRRSGEGDLPPTEEMVRERRSGFRRGFSIALVAMVLLLGLYVLAPSIAARVPATEPALAAYVARVDALRLWLDARMRSSAEAIRGDETGG